jgi:hypothetical protein
LAWRGRGGWVWPTNGRARLPNIPEIRRAIDDESSND